mmetsp:Transcript_33977/g.81342  ORF Transcript_33977/g.81342 Transcript_33977/m.81342 type:complete len:218 (+) Transcript_33977:864-1517(+)
MTLGLMGFPPRCTARLELCARSILERLFPPRFPTRLFDSRSSKRVAFWYNAAARVSTPALVIPLSLSDRYASVLFWWRTYAMRRAPSSEIWLPSRWSLSTCVLLTRAMVSVASLASTMLKPLRTTFFSSGSSRSILPMTVLRYLFCPYPFAIGEDEQSIALMLSGGLPLRPSLRFFFQPPFFQRLLSTREGTLAALGDLPLSQRCRLGLSRLCWRVG